MTVVDNLFSGRKGNIQYMLDNPHFHFVQGSFTDPSLLNDVFRGADGVFHQAAIPSVPRSIRDPVATNNTKVN
ncbi:NAD-dependent epimerase/dehydratase family protein, partial [Klebsiella pneumoniae]|uniref:NAD-dependent epimerase/dehydratase family protein n=1 Tax=Klebsiella pneumoniae TaxID=573 RepID=UPI0030155F7B